MWHWYSVPERSEVLTQQIVHWLVCFIVVCLYWCNVLQALLCRYCLIIACLSMICCEGAFLYRHSQCNPFWCNHFWCKMSLQGLFRHLLQTPTTESYFSPTYLYFLILRGTQKISFIFNHLRAKKWCFWTHSIQTYCFTRYITAQIFDISTLAIVTVVAIDSPHNKSIPVVHNTYNPDTGHYFSKATQDSYLLEDIRKLLIYKAENSKTEQGCSLMSKIRPFLCTDI